MSSKGLVQDDGETLPLAAHPAELAARVDELEKRYSLQHLVLEQARAEGTKTPEEIATIRASLSRTESSLRETAGHLRRAIDDHAIDHYRREHEGRFIRFWSWSANAGRVVSAPGSALLRVLPYLFSKRTIERVFAQAIADMRDEYFAALAAQQPWLARSIRLRWAFSVVNTVVLQWGVSLLKQVIALWKLGRS